ncbi:glycosyl hydrolase family 95 catalytic domain-containing protein [Microbacterium radiodurans]|uniref:Uncharacterized protein n=1 Tax=Microbacterium radiodurans TaxID=661398 RepID=A0A5J5IWY5_9MICO|nr:glycoside hydrolase N-terminal domain-containing protein [Microbacterium radiodurans]KAA9089796.1 hypothetical protein F6B42_04905 [Microbacterium radiodurans]
MSTLTFTTPARTWLERLPLGNGRLGAMVGVDGGETRIGLNESSAWSGGVASARRESVEPEAAAVALAAARSALDAGDPVGAEQHLRVLQHRYAQAFLPVGELIVTAGGDRSAPLRRSLDLTEGVHRARSGALESSTACTTDPDLLIHTIRTSVPVDVGVRFATPLRVRDERMPDPSARTWVLDLPADVAPAHEPDEPAVTWDVPGIRPASVVVSLRLRHDGALSDAPDGLTVRGATRVELALAIETTVPATGHDPEPIDEALRRADARLAACAEPARHVEENRARRSAASGFSFELGAPPHDREGGRELVDPLGGSPTAPEALLGFLVEYGHHLLGAASRRGGPPANLQGIWNADMRPPWSSGYTLNINTPMNYWGAEVTGAADAHLALLEMLEALAAHGADTAARLYGAGGWVAHHNSDLWGYSPPTRGDASWSQWPLGGAWLVRQFDEHRRHGSMSRATLARYRPVVSGCARFLLDLLVDDGSGGLGTAPSTSPENRFLTARGPAALTRSSALDRALIADVLDIAGTVLADTEPDLAAEALAARSRIAGPRIGVAGRIAEWQGDPHEEDPRHRHVSHLFPWFPGDRVAEPAERAAVAATLDRRGDDSTGWSLAWKIALRARLRDADGVSRLIDLALRPAQEEAGNPAHHRGGLYPNLFAAHPPFQIDGNLGLVGAMLECVVQSHRPGCIDLLPAAPPVLARGRLRGAVVRPGILLDLDWADGRPGRVSLRARSADQAGRYRLTAADRAVDVDIAADRVTVLRGAELAIEPLDGRLSSRPTPDRSTT